MTIADYKPFFDLEALIKDIKKYQPKFDVNKFKKAFYFAEEAHRGQMRKDGVTPYISHPVSAVKILAEMHADTEVLISALLHDVPEDTERTVKDIEKAFGKQIAFLVDGITKLSKVHYKNDMSGRAVESLKKLILHASKDPRVVLIKLADRLHNMRTLDNIDKPEKRLRIAGETLEIYVPIANLLGIQYLRIELQELCFKYLFPPEFEEISEKIKEQKKAHGASFSKFKRKLTKVFGENKIEADVFERKRNLYGIYKKLSAEGKSIASLKDRISVRILVENVNQCYQILGLIHGVYKPKANKFSDYIANPKANGYMSLHTTVFGPDGIETQIQIRTEEMNLQVEYGIAEHFLKKQGDKLSQDRRSNWAHKAIELQENGEENGEYMKELKAEVFQDRILIFTPKGKSVDLPKGSTVIDFAYAIHTEIGNHAVRAEINGRNLPITTILCSSDVVNIVTEEKAHPELFWFSFVRTNFARNKIKNYLRKAGKDLKITEARKILQKEFDISALGMLRKMSFRKMKAALKREFNKEFSSLEEILVALGEGDINAVDVVKAIKKNELKKKGIKVIVKVVCENKFGLLKEITDIFYRNSLDMNYLKGYASDKQAEAYFTVRVVVDDLGSIGRIFDELAQIPSVKYVYRISSKGLWLTGSALVGTGLLWILHPFALQFYSEQYPAVVNLSLLLLFVAVLSSTGIVKKYFPYERNKKTLWIVAFAVPLLALLALAFQIFYLDLRLSWLAMALELAMIYAYLGVSFVNFQKKA